MIIYWDNLEKSANDDQTIPEYIASNYVPSVHFARNIYWEGKPRESGKPENIPQYIASDYFTRGINIAPITWDGWLEAKEAWTYATVKTLTITGDQTIKYPKGSKIKLTNDSTEKTYYVENAVYSSPNTTLTLAGETDLVNGDITNPYYSYIECPAGFKKGEVWYRASVYRETDQTLTEITLTQAQFDTEVYDPNENYASYEYTVPITGIYSITMMAEIYNSGNKAYNIYGIIRKDSTNIGENRTDFYPGMGTIATIVIATIDKLTKGQKIKGYVYIDTQDGSTGIMRGARNLNNMTIQFVGV